MSGVPHGLDDAMTSKVLECGNDTNVLKQVKMMESKPHLEKELNIGRCYLILGNVKAKTHYVNLNINSKM